MTSNQKPASYCAIYTRKSSEEGLEQSFNSLDAQREACEAFILSRADIVRFAGAAGLETATGWTGFVDAHRAFCARDSLRRVAADMTFLAGASAAVTLCEGMALRDSSRSITAMA